MSHLVGAWVNTYPPGWFLENTGMNAMAPVTPPNPIPISDEELTAAAAILAPGQMAALKALAEQQQALRALRAAKVR